MRAIKHLVGHTGCWLGVFLAGLGVARPAYALLNAGIEAGAVKRTASSDDPKWGFGYGAHAELGLAPALSVGAYFLRSTNSIANAPVSTDATFNTLGLRAKLTLPMPGDTKPYGFVGFGSTWTKYSAAGTDVSGHSWEIPIGIGIAHKVLELFQLSLEGAYRPSMSFSGDAYDNKNIGHPSSGWSALVGFAIDL